MKITLDENAIMPTKAHKEDAGWDLYAKETKTVPARGSATFNTGVHVAIPYGFMGLVASKSGLNVNHNLTSEGIIDCNYTGSIVVKLYNNGDENYVVRKGDKISQLVITMIGMQELELVDHLEKTDRGDNGFGSTGR